MQLPGGKGVFPSLTVEQNLAVQRAPQRELARARSTRGSTRMYELFPELEDRRKQIGDAACRAVSSRCSRSRRVLIHEPEHPA